MIVANAVVLGLQTYPGLVERYGDVLDLLNALFLAVFVVELLLRIASYGRRPQDFFRNGWNVFDFFVVSAAFLPGVRGLDLASARPSAARRPRRCASCPTCRCSSSPSVGACRRSSASSP